jgi:hypothetical protein
MQTEVLLTDLENRTRQLIREAELLLEKPDSFLNRRPAPESWSVLECLEHLNRYGRFYLPEINKRIRESHGKESSVFKSGWLGNYFANSMLPKDSGMKKMKTFRNMNPIHSKLEKQVIVEFLEQQQEMLRLLGKARKVNLNQTKTNISISKWIKLKLGDTFRFVIYHNERHLAQAQRIQ